MKKNTESKQKKTRHDGLQIPVYSKLAAYKNPSNIFDPQTLKGMDQNDANLHDTSPLVSQGNNPSEAFS